MRTNLFAIFRFCTEVLRNVGEVGYDDSSSPKPPSAASGLKIVDEVLDIITTYSGMKPRRIRSSPIDCSTKYGML
jgi:hypothetical protein